MFERKCYLGLKRKGRLCYLIMFKPIANFPQIISYMDHIMDHHFISICQLNANYNGIYHNRC